jgi:hypothetical protein
LGLSKKSKSNKILTQINEDQLQESDTIAIKSMKNDIDEAIVHYAHKHPTVAFDVLAKKTNACLGQIPKTSKAAQQKALRVSLQLVQEILDSQCSAADEMIEMKYASQEQFYEHYDSINISRNIAETDRDKLFRTANWMNMLFRIIPAKQNKELALAVVTKFVEGIGASYVTGSGQTTATTDRVLIYQNEGLVIPNKRNPRKRKPDGNESDSSSNDFSEEIIAIPLLNFCFCELDSVDICMSEEG